MGFLEAAGLSADLVGAFDAAIRPAGWQPAIRSSLEALPALAATGVRLAIVSNSDGTVEERLVRAGVAQVGPGPGVALQALIDSGVVGIEKPDPRIFALALTACGVDPDAAVHVGDSRRTDVAGAVAAGIRPLPRAHPHRARGDRAGPARRGVRAAPGCSAGRAGTTRIFVIILRRYAGQVRANRAGAHAPHAPVREQRPAARQARPAAGKGRTATSVRPEP